MKIDLKERMREVRFITEHTLTNDQLNKLIEDKIKRAEWQHRLNQVHKEQTLQYVE